MSKTQRKIRPINSPRSIAQMARHGVKDSKRYFELIPIADRIIVERDTEEFTKGGLVLPDKSQTRALIGTVRAAGEECVRVKVGDRVLFAQFSGKEFFDDLPFDVYERFKGWRYMNEIDVICIVREEK